MFSIIIPTFNNIDYLKICLNSIKKNSSFDHEIIIHINEGVDGTLEFVKNNNIKFPELGKPLRVILLGSSDAPSISEIMHALGKDKVLKRINNFLI